MVETRVPSRRRSHRRHIGVVTALALATLISLVACAPAAQVVPQTVVWAPGSYTLGIPFGNTNTLIGPEGVILVCSSTPRVLYVSVVGWEVGAYIDGWTGFDGSSSTGHVYLSSEFNIDNNLNPFPDYAVTTSYQTGLPAPEPAGCGRLHVYTNNGNPGPYTGPPTISVRITTSPPA